MHDEILHPEAMEYHHWSQALLSASSDPDEEPEDPAYWEARAITEAVLNPEGSDDFDQFDQNLENA